MIAWIVLYIAASYLVGAVPFGYLAGRIRGLDLRREGSCNIGATNAWRVLGWKWGLSVFALDFLKGFVPVFGALNWLPFLTGDAGGWDFNAVVVLVCFAVVLGHTYTCFLGFRGGKGVATTAGVLFALNPVVACVALGAWLVFMGISGIVVAGQPGGCRGDDRRRMVVLPALPGRGRFSPDTLHCLFHGGGGSGHSQAPFQHREAPQRNGTLLLFQKVQVR